MAACSVTGVGENIMRAAFARTASKAILRNGANALQACQETMQREILDKEPMVADWLSYE